MYRKFLPIALVALFSTMLFGCTEDVLSPDNPTMKAEVGGTDKETTSVTALKGASTINLTGSFSDGTGISFSLKLVDAPTTIDLEGNVDNIVTYTMTSPVKSFIATEGEVEIKTIDDTGITGTFSFTGAEVTSSGSGETIEVKDGSFSAKFQ